MEVLRVRAGDWLDRPLEEGAMPENQKQPRVHPGQAAEGAVRASMTMNTVQFEYPKKHYCRSHGRAGKSPPSPKGNRPPLQKGTTRWWCSRQVRIRVVDPSHWKRASVLVLGWSIDALMHCRGWSLQVRKQSVQIPYTFKLLVTTMLVCESKTVKIKDEMQTATETASCPSAAVCRLSAGVVHGKTNPHQIHFFTL